MTVAVRWRPVVADADLTSLDAAEHRRLEAIRTPGARRSQACSYALRREVLAPILGCAPAAVRFTRRCDVCGAGDHGKPHVAGATAFSVSRAPEAVAIATLDGADVGLDLAAEQPASVWERIGDRVSRHDDDPLTPLQAWTAKEAVLKLVGCGLTRPMTDVRLRADGRWEIPALERAGHVVWGSPADRLLCAVATDDPHDIRITTLGRCERQRTTPGGKPSR